MTAPIRSMPEYELYRVILDYEALQDGFLDRIEDLNTTLAGMVIVALIGTSMMLALNMRGDVRAEVVARIVDGIEIGYLCQKRGWTESECKADFTGYMAKAKVGR